MSWVAVEHGGDEVISDRKPKRDDNFLVWLYEIYVGYEEIDTTIYLPKGSIKKLIGRELTWEDEPVELK
jgi:hypothetical protein